MDEQLRGIKGVKDLFENEVELHSMSPTSRTFNNV